MKGHLVTRSDIAHSRIHHNVFYRFPPWQGVVPEGFLANFLGVMTRASFWPPYVTLTQEYPSDRQIQTEYPAFDEEYLEWIDLLEAATSAEDRFTMCELGAGWGRWITNAVAALRKYSDLPYMLVAVEAEPTHFQWMIQHLQYNGVNLEDCRLIEAAVTGRDGKVGFHAGETPFGGPANWYGQSIGGPTEVDAVSLETVLQPLNKVDLIDMDVQGTELEVVEAAVQQLEQKVKRIHIETHNENVEFRLISLFMRLGWKNLNSYRCNSESETQWGKIYFQGGVQTWINPRFLKNSYGLSEPATRTSSQTLSLSASREEGNMATPQPLTAAWPIDLSQDPVLRKSFDLLRRKWGEVPYTQFSRVKSKELLALSDREILDIWTRAYSANAMGAAFSVRGWYQVLYKDSLRGKKILDVGCGLGPDSVFFAEHGAAVTFMDIVEANVQFVKRVCTIKGLKNVDFCYMEDLDSLSVLPKDYDIIYCCGSFINAPLELARMEAQALLEHLPIGGRWIELGYPKSRWEREGRLSFDRWGEKTDGGAPWIEWHDLRKLRYILAPATFDVILELEFHNSDFNWFDLLRVPGNFEPGGPTGKDANTRNEVGEPVHAKRPPSRTRDQLSGSTSLKQAAEEENQNAASPDSALAQQTAPPEMLPCSATEGPSVPNPTAEEDLWDRKLKLRRPAITEGFAMPGFAGKYWIWPEEYALLAKYVDLTQGDYLEIGSMCGIIAMSLAEKYPHRRFVCVDAFVAGHGTIAGERETFFQNLRENKLKNVALIEGDSLKVVPTLSQKFEIVLIDGNHAYEYVLGDALNSWRLLVPGGFLVFHDYECVEETTRAVNDFLKQTGARLVEVISSLAVACKPAQLQAHGERKEASEVQAKIMALETQMLSLKESLGPEAAKARAQVEHLEQVLQTLRDELEHVEEQKSQLEAVWRAVENSAGWRLLNAWREARDRMIPLGTRRRRLYDAVLQNFRGSG